MPHTPGRTTSWRSARPSVRWPTSGWPTSGWPRMRPPAAVERERYAYAEFRAVGDASIGEMFTLNRAGLDRLGELLDHIGPAWEADAALREITGRDTEAGQ
jgi:hypothetical protein